MPVHVRAPFAEVLHNVEPLRLNFGALVLHATQTALALSRAPSGSSIYLPVLEALRSS